MWARPAADRALMLITSSSNERIKHARRVREGRERHLIFVEGERLVRECIASGLRLQICFASPEFADSLRGQAQCEVFEVADSVLSSLSDTQNTQGIILIAERPGSTLDPIFARACPLIIGLDRVQDPGNFGSLVRTAEGAGATGVLAFAGSADAFAPKTLRSSMGSAFRLPMVTDVSGIGAIKACRDRGIRSVIACGHAELEHYDYDWRQPSMLILGNEARGAGDELMKACDARVRIPLHEPVESLNVAAAGAAILFEAARQRKTAQ